MNTATIFCGVGQRFPKNRKTGYYLVLNQSAGAGQRDIVITKPANDSQQAFCAEDAIKSLSHTRPDEISIKNSAASNLNHTQLTQLISHELGHSLGLANSEFECAAGDIMSLTADRLTCGLGGTFAITDANVSQSNRNLGSNRDTCTANATRVNQTPQSPEECGDAGMYWNFSSGTCSATYAGASCEESTDCSEFGSSGGVLPYDPCYNEDGCANGYYLRFSSSSGGRCCSLDPSPVLIDVAGNGFSMTSAAEGVDFDFVGVGQTMRLSWVAAGSDDAWLVLDRNGKGRIDSAKEMFGNITAQPPSREANGFLALAEFDRPQQGGNGDGRISQLDSIFANLRLWQDVNHNAFSEASELRTLPELGLAIIDLDYKESSRTDDHGNRFKYRAKVRDVCGARISRWAWDVFLVRQR